MARELDHLALQPSTSSGLKLRPDRLSPRDRDRERFAKSALARIRAIVSDYDKSEPPLHGREQDLLFKMWVRKYGGPTVKRSLKRADCHPLVARPDERFPWVVTARDKTLSRLQRDLEESSGKLTYVDAISEFSGIEPAEKLGELLRTHPIRENEADYVVVDILKKSDSVGNDLRNDTVEMIRDLAGEHGFDIHGKFVSKNMCQVLVMTNTELLNKLLLVYYVYRIDRRPEFEVSRLVENHPGVDHAEPTRPPRDAHGILVLDTGMVKHPLLYGVIKEDYALRPNRADTKSHGTQVGGVAAYADLRKCIETATFKPEVHICSGQLIYNDARSGSRGLASVEMGVYVDRIQTSYPRCRVANMSILSTSSTIREGRQPDLAMAMDELSNEHKNMLFVVAAGNLSDREKTPHGSYEKLSLKMLDEISLPDPATSAHAITVGGIMRYRAPEEYTPSASTMLGSGVNGMIKPDLVDVGGDKHDKVAVLSNTPHKKWFVMSAGTSLSAPVVSNYAARLMNQFPSASRNLVTALLLSSAMLPANLPDVGNRTRQETNAILLHLYGHGKPHLAAAMHSGQNRVVLTHDGKIGLQTVQYFPIPMPVGFFQIRGPRTISVALSFDPPCSRDELSYMGIRMEFKIFANQPVESVKVQYDPDSHTDAAENSTSSKHDPEHAAFRPRVLKMDPGIMLRKKTNHQKGTHTSTNTMPIASDPPLVLAVSCAPMWDSLDLSEQTFSIAVSVTHEGIDLLYDKIKDIHMPHARARPT